jgi:hypothetical protein
MSSTRRSTPVAPAPIQVAEVAEKARSFVLKAPIVVVTSSGEWELERGGLVIGRGPDANMFIDDPLVSRAHARLSVLPDERVIVEDMHSTNGLFINGMRLARPTASLSEGDRLLIGTTEISVFSTRASAKMPIGKRIAEVRLTPKPRPAVSPPVPVLREPLQPASKPIPTTERSDAVELVGLLAGRLMASGHPLEATRVLSEHLNSVLLGASAGLSVPYSVLDHATRYALDLYQWTRRPSWIDYPFELHVACQQMPSEGSIDALEAVYATAPGVDRSLVEYLVQTLQSKQGGVRREEQLRLARLIRLAQFQ